MVVGVVGMVQDLARLEDLFPSARGLFQERNIKVAPPALPMFAWVVAGALAALLGRQLLYWADHNI